MDKVNVGFSSLRAVQGESQVFLSVVSSQQEDLIVIPTEQGEIAVHSRETGWLVLHSELEDSIVTYRRFQRDKDEYCLHRFIPETGEERELTIDGKLYNGFLQVSNSTKLVLGYRRQADGIWYSCIDVEEESSLFCVNTRFKDPVFFDNSILSFRNLKREGIVEAFDFNTGELLQSYSFTANRKPYTNGKF